MSGNNEPRDLYAAIEKTSEILGVPCSRERVWPLLAAYGQAIPQAMVAFRVSSDTKHRGELDCRISLPNEADPYGVALSKGFIDPTSHPAGSVATDLLEKCPINSYGVDFGVVAGFKKIWIFFPEDDFQALTKLAEIPSMPRSVGENIDYFSRHGLDRAGLIGVDYRNRTMNVYFTTKEGPGLAADDVLAMHRDIGLPDPSEPMLKFCRQAFALYTTHNWDSPKIGRLAFSVMTREPNNLPVRLGPEIERFVSSVPYGADAPRMAHAAVAASGEEYYKLQSYYKWRPHKVNLKPSADSALNHT